MRQTEVKSISLISDKIWPSGTSNSHNKPGFAGRRGLMSTPGFIQPLRGDTIFNSPPDPLDCLGYQHISPEKPKETDDIPITELKRDFTCFESYDLHEGFKSVLFLTPPTLHDCEAASTKSQASESYAFSKFSSSSRHTVKNQQSLYSATPLEWSAKDPELMSSLTQTHSCKSLIDEQKTEGKRLH